MISISEARKQVELAITFIAALELKGRKEPWTQERINGLREVEQILQALEEMFAVRHPEETDGE